MKEIMTDKNYVRTVSSAKAELWHRLKRKLTHLDIELTERCNNNCVHCTINLPVDDEQARLRELTTDDLKKILKEAAALGCLSVRYTGGEPLLRPDFNELYLFAKRLGMKVILFTNATLLTEETVALLKKYPPGEVVEVTVYGMSRETYEAVSRVKGTYEAAFRGIRLLQENDIAFIVKGAFLPQNKADVEEFETWAKTIPALDHAPSYSMFFDLRTRRDSEAANERIRRLRPATAEAVAMLTRDHDSYFKGMREFCGKFMRPSGDPLFSCGAGRKSGTVDAYGRLQVCMLLRHPDTVYDLRCGTLEDALDHFFPNVLASQAQDSDYLQKCAGCFLKGLCEQCPGKAWAEHGELDKPVSYLCEVAHEQARHLGLLGKDEFSWQVSDWRRRLDDFVKSTENYQTINQSSSEREGECPR